jgi:ferritin
MELNEKIRKALNDQIAMELSSSYVYQAMRAYFLDLGLKGCAAWMKSQAEEETGHAMRMFAYLDERRARVTLQAIPAPPAAWDSPLAAFKDALAHEQKVTRSIHAIADLSLGEKDHATYGFLDWFIKEQVEEESSVSEVLDRLALIEGQKPMMYLFDRQMGKRGGEGEEE